MPHHVKHTPILNIKSQGATYAAWFIVQALNSIISCSAFNYIIPPPSKQSPASQHGWRAGLYEKWRNRR